MITMTGQRELKRRKPKREAKNKNTNVWSNCQQRIRARCLLFTPFAKNWTAITIAVEGKQNRTLRLTFGEINFFYCRFAQLTLDCVKLPFGINFVVENVLFNSNLFQCMVRISIGFDLNWEICFSISPH